MVCKLKLVLIIILFMQLIDLLYYPGKKKILFEVLALKTNPTDTCYIPDNHCLKLKSVQDSPQFSV